jgi:hypothetical protein
MDKEHEDKFIQLLSRVDNEELKADFLKCFLDISSEMDNLMLKKRNCCIPCISTCSNNHICNDNETDVSV